MKLLYELIITNWQTTAKAVIPFLVMFGARYGYDLSIESATAILSGIYAVLLVLSRDAKKV
jgi:hypothetical protein